MSDPTGFDNLVRWIHSLFEKWPNVDEGEAKLLDAIVNHPGYQLRSSDDEIARMAKAIEDRIKQEDKTGSPVDRIREALTNASPETPSVERASSRQSPRTPAGEVALTLGGGSEEQARDALRTWTFTLPPEDPRIEYATGSASCLDEDLFVKVIHRHGSGQLEIMLSGGLESEKHIERAFRVLASTEDLSETRWVKDLSPQQMVIHVAIPTGTEMPGALHMSYADPKRNVSLVIVLALA